MVWLTNRGARELTEDELEEHVQNVSEVETGLASLARGLGAAPDPVPQPR